MLAFFRPQEPAAVTPAGTPAAARSPSKLSVCSQQAGDPELHALLAEEARLQVIVEHQRRQIAEVQQRLHASMEPDMSLIQYTRDLEGSVLQEDKAKEARALAAEASAELTRARQSLQEHEDMAARGMVQFKESSAQFSQIATDIAFLQTQVNSKEFSLGQARSHYAQHMEMYSKHIEECKMHHRGLEGRRSELEVEVSKLEAEVRWYRMRCGEELA
mmetsp:Transcript_109000/g.234879  ORF Transcript_109000/g.234879 Transcript_109000/m.234879 type:complete len:217 (+) Transcript_109000:89-739(+)